MTVDDDAPPFSFVTMEGPVALSDDVAQVREWAARIAGRYMGEHRATHPADVKDLRERVHDANHTLNLGC